MRDGKTVTLHEWKPRDNWPSGSMPDWVDEGTRLYTGVEIKAAGRTWKEIIVVFDGESTTAYLTKFGFDLVSHGPAIHRAKGKGACYRKVVREWFRAFMGTEVTFS